MLYTDKNMPDDISALKEVTGSGYERMDVIKQIQEMTKEYKALEKALELKEWGKEYTKPEEFRKFRLRAARSAGYSVDSVKAYIDRLEDKIKHMRHKLTVERDKKNWNQEWQNPENK